MLSLEVKKSLKALDWNYLECYFNPVIASVDLI